MRATVKLLLLAWPLFLAFIAPTLPAPDMLPATVTHISDEHSECHGDAVDLSPIAEGFVRSSAVAPSIGGE